MTPVPIDSALPQLATVLDPQAMRPILAARLWRTGGDPARYRLGACTVERVRYRPGRSCMVSYRLHIDDVRSGRRSPHLLTARVYPLRESARRFAKASGGAACTQGPGLLHIADLGLIAWGFPADRKLVYLPLFAETRRLCETVLPQVVSAGWGPRARLVAAATEIVHYVPEQGCTVRAELAIAIGVRTERAVLYGKTYADASAEGTASRLRIIAAHFAMLRASGVAGVPEVPAVVGCQSAFQALWTHDLGGRPIAGEALSAARLAEVAAAIAALHSVPPPDQVLTSADLIGRLDLAARTIGAAQPDLQERAARLADAIAARLRTLDASPRVTIHGDLHLKNILCGPERLGLVDFDALAAGPGAVDLGSLLAALCHRRLIGGAGGDVLQGSASFIAAYQRAGDAITSRRPRNSAAEVGACLAYALVAERAYRAISRMKPGRADHVRALLALAARALGEGAP